MKSIKLLLLFVTLSLTFSCSDSDPIQNTDDTQESISLRTMVHELKKANNITGRMADNNPFCFDFVYPVTFSYSNDISITAETFAGLIEIITDETPSIYLSAIQFPFQVQHEGAIQTIATEAQFHALLVECGFNTFNEDLSESFCFDIVFPIEIINASQEIVTVSNIEMLNAEIGNPANGTAIQIVFPINVIYDNQTVTVDNLYEFYQMVTNCNSCICTQEYVPVCVQTANGVMEFGNMCYALCAGYTQNDLVSCNPNGCDITDLEVTVGACNADGSYQLTIDFNYSNPTSAQFEVRNANNLLIGTYQLSALPLILNNYVGNGQDTDFLTISLVGNTVCQATQYWLSPDCGCGCTTDFDPVCVMTPTGLVQYDNACMAICAGHSQNEFVVCNTAQYNFGESLLDGCFDMVYPLQVQHQGALVTVTVDGQLLQYWNPTISPMPIFNYPVSATFGNTTYIFNNQQEFEAQIIASCQ